MRQIMTNDNRFASEWQRLSSCIDSQIGSRTSGRSSVRLGRTLKYVERRSQFLFLLKADLPRKCA